MSAPASAAELAEALGGKKAGRGYTALCPAHDDHNPSLSIDDGDKGIVVRCQAGCTQDEVIDSLRGRGLWAPVNGHKRANAAGPQKASRKIVAEYDYVDERGNTLFTVVRFEPKEFRQRQPGGKDAPPTWNVRGVRTVLYRLPRVLDAISKGETIYIVEGEKDALTLEKLRFCATCNSGGAGVGKFKAEHAAPLRGADVVIICDNDAPGREHGEGIARMLQGHAKRIRIIRELPDVPEKGDISDWLGAEPSAEAFSVLVDEHAKEWIYDHQSNAGPGGDSAAPNPDAQFQQRQRLRPKALAELVGQPPPILRVARTLPARGLGVVFGDSGCGKTFLIIDLVVALVLERRWFDRRVRRCGAIYVAAEGRLGLRLQAYMKHHGVTLEDIGDRFRVIDSAVNLLDPYADVPTLLEELNAAASAMGGVGLVVVDTLNRVMPGGDENSSEDMSAVIASAKRIEEALGCLVLFIHHSGKNAAAGARGHSSLRAACEFEAEVKDANGDRTMEITKFRDGEEGAQLPFRLKVVDLGAVRDLDGEADEDERITSCVVVPETEVGERASPKLSPSAKLGLDALYALMHDGGERLPGTSTIPAGVYGVKLEAWKSRFLTVYGENSGASASSQAKAFKRLKDDLLSADLIGMSDPWVWLRR